MPTEVKYAVKRLPNRDRDLFAVMRNSITIAKYVDEDVAWRICEALRAAQSAEY